jgi:hypothetical protein
MWKLCTVPLHRANTTALQMAVLVPEIMDTTSYVSTDYSMVNR